ncbi:MFS transporter [uncultured Agitococcus sp.]|uniref:MFS transporter n=1 Tax=uncultured Agitococcus sp. TaxID=1506599 RepID=UPI0026092925|nr:MFS transporter [uncultured Agitococcus sp.]
MTNHLWADKRFWVLLTLYMAQGLPTGIFSQGLPAILRSYDVSLKVIGFTSLLAIPWALKFLWAPYIDKYYSTRIGQSRTWILPMQLLSMLLLLAIAFFEPKSLATQQGLIYFLALMFLLNLVAASQDVATDGLAVRNLNYEERSWGNGLQVAGYRLGLIIGGGFLLYLVGVWQWQAAFLLMTALLLLISLPIWFYKEHAKPKTAKENHDVNYHQVFISFMAQKGFKPWLGVLITYKVGESLGSAMVKPMFVDMGLKLEQIGLFVSVIGSVATLLGAALAGWWVKRLGRYLSLLYFGVAQAFGVACYAYLSWQWQEHQQVVLWQIYAINAIEHFMSGMAIVALLAAVMDYARHQHAGTDFTIQVSILTIFGGSASLAAGFLAHSVGYTAYYLISAALALVFLWPVVLWGRWLKA